MPLPPGYGWEAPRSARRSAWRMLVQRREGRIQPLPGGSIGIPGSRPPSVELGPIHVQVLRRSLDIWGGEERARYQDPAAAAASYVAAVLLLLDLGAY